MSQALETLQPDAAEPVFEFIQVERTDRALGAEILGVDLAKPLDDRVFAEIHAAWLRYNVVFFRGQDLTPKQYVDFAKRWGEIHLHPFMRGLDDHPEIFEIVKTEDDTRNFGNRWHTDQMFCAEPAKATMLYACEVPPLGGDTMFTNLYAAYDTLSDGMKSMLAGVRTRSNGNKSQGGKLRTERYAGAMAAKVAPPDEPVISEHPLIRTHPETGRKALYAGSHVERFADMTDEESAPLMSYLMRHAKRPEFTCRFKWQPGSIAVWDNRCCQHYAVNDYPGERRRMHRITIKGDRPF